MAITEVPALHGRYARVVDRFKSIWTYHQFAGAVYKTFLGRPLPYDIDFHGIYQVIRAVGARLHSNALHSAEALDASESELDEATTNILAADEGISPSVLRRFFDRLKKQEDEMIELLIRFYLHAGRVDGDYRDKLDLLFTRIGEDYITERRDLFPLRERVMSLVSVMPANPAPQSEVVQIIMAIRSLRDEIQQAAAFDDLAERNLFKHARLFKHRVGPLYFHPDVLLAILELNVASKNRYAKLYESEERRILDDAQKLMQHGEAIERNFGESNPDLAGEIARFREFKERFDELRAQSNVKIDAFAQLKGSINNILRQLDRGLTAEEEAEELPAAFFTEAEQLENLSMKFGREEMLLRFLQRIANAVAAADPTLEPRYLVDIPAVRDLRLEPWEASAYQKLFDRRLSEAEEDNEDLWMLYVRAAALRMKIDAEATILATARNGGVHPDQELLSEVARSLDCAKELDALFGDFLHEAVYYSNPKILHQLYRSRFRLLRGFSGLWLIYDRDDNG